MQTMKAALLALPVMVVALFSTSNAQPLVFQAETIKDTFLTYEQVWVLFSARNISDTNVAYNPLRFDATSIQLQMYDQSGESVKGSEYTTTYGPFRGQVTFLKPGDSVTGHCSLERMSIFTDSTARLTYLPAGSYTAEFRWQYVFCRLPPFPPEDFLVDSVSFVVVDPKGRDRQALEFYRSIRRAVDSNLDWSEAHWKCYTSFADTPYGDNALSSLAILTAGGAVPPPPGMSRPQVCREFALGYPDDPSVESPIRRAVKMLDPAEGILFLREILDSVPGTLAGQYAATLLSEAD